MKDSLFHIFHEMKQLQWLITYYYLKQRNIHPGQIPILLNLYKADGRSQKELVEILHVAPSTITVSIQRLIKGGYIIKESDKLDKRKSVIKLTDEGKNICKSIIKAKEKIQDISLNNFSTDELEQLLFFMNKIKDNLSIELNKIEKNKKEDNKC